MSEELNSNSLVKTDLCGNSTKTYLKAAYTITHPEYEDLDCDNVSKRDAIEVLLSDSDLRNFLEKEYNQERENRFDEEECESYCKEHALENAKYFGYKIEERYV